MQLSHAELVNHSKKKSLHSKNVNLLAFRPTAFQFGLKVAIAIAVWLRGPESTGRHVSFRTCIIVLLSSSHSADEGGKNESKRGLKSMLMTIDGRQGQVKWRYFCHGGESCFEVSGLRGRNRARVWGRLPTFILPVQRTKSMMTGQQLFFNKRLMWNVIIVKIKIKIKRVRRSPK